MKQKIRKIMNFASCGIHSNYRNTDKLEGYLDLLEEVEAYIKEAEKTASNTVYAEIAKCKECQVANPDMGNCFYCFSRKLEGRNFA